MHDGSSIDRRHVEYVIEWHELDPTSPAGLERAELVFPPRAWRSAIAWRIKLRHELDVRLFVRRR